MDKYAYSTALAQGDKMPAIFSSLSSLFLCEKYSDMTIRCAGREFKAHCAIVCSQSPFFDRAISVGFAETVTRIVDLPEDDPDILHCFLEFLYTGAYGGGVRFTGGVAEPILFLSAEELAEVLAAPVGEELPPVTAEDNDPTWQADGETNAEPEEEYEEFDDDNELEDLQSQAQEGPVRIEDVDMELAQKEREHAVLIHLRLYIMADKYDVPALRVTARAGFHREIEICFAKNLPLFCEVIDELYSFTTEKDFAIREIACRLGAAGLNDSCTRREMQPVMRKHGDFAVEAMEYALTYLSL